jgi:hypothetical protein
VGPFYIITRTLSGPLLRYRNHEVSGDHKAAMIALGEGLHTVQDQGAHSEQGAGWNKHITGSPDDPIKHSKEFENSQLRSEDYVNKFKQAVIEMRIPIR